MLIFTLGIHDVECIQSMLSDYVKNTMFAQLDDDELPSPENSRYFPTKRVSLNSSDSRVLRASGSGAVDSSLIFSQVKPMTLKLVFTASLLDAQH